MGENVVISIIDDDESLRKAIKRLLNSVGLGVEDFATAEEFLRSGGPHDSACLILNVQLPGMSGLALQRQLAIDGLRIPIIFISARCNEEERASAIEAGAVDFLEKPFGEKALVSAVNLSLERK